MNRRARRSTQPCSLQHGGDTLKHLWGRKTTPTGHVHPTQLRLGRLRAHGALTGVSTKRLRSPLTPQGLQGYRLVLQEPSVPGPDSPCGFPAPPTLTMQT